MKGLESETLREWLTKVHTTQEYQRLLFNMDDTMHYLHNHGYGIRSQRNAYGYPEFNIDHIQVLTMPQGSFVRFNDIDKIDPQYQNNLVAENINNLAFLAIKAYTGILDYLNPNFVKAHFEEDFKPYLPLEDVAYYRGVLENNANVYYTTYVQMRIKKDWQQEDQTTEKNQSQSNRYENVYTKATAEGRKIVENQINELEDQNNMGAFIQLYFFPAIIIGLSMIIPLLAWLFALIEKK